MTYPNIVKALHSTAWAIMPEKMDAMLRVLDVHIIGAEPSSASNVPPRRPSPARGGVKVLPLVGVLSQRMDLMTESSGGTSTDRFATDLRLALADPAVGAVVLDVDSPGGSVYGIKELSDVIYEARGDKPIVAAANSLMASAAFWVGSAADEIVATPGAEVGSVGVIAVHIDTSEANAEAGLTHTIISSAPYKAEGNSLEPLGDEARAALQARVDEYHAMFVADLARNRGISRKQVESDFGGGRIFGAEKAVVAGMVDRIGTLDRVIGELSGRIRRTRRRRAAMAVRHIAAENVT